MIVSVAPVESFAADLDVAVEEFSDETDEPVVVENEDETLGDESAEVEIQDEDGQQDIDYDEENGADVFSDGGETSGDLGESSEGITASGELSESITWTLYNNGELVIQGSGDMPDYVYPWKSYQIKNIRFVGEITGIGDHAFRDLDITEIEIPKSVTNIGRAAFWACSKLEHVNMSEGLTSIENSAFSDCVSLKDIVIPDSVTNIGSGVFKGCSSLTDVTLSKGMTKIEDGMFWDCTNLKNIAIPSEITSIGERAFQNCSNLEKIKITKSMTICENAFSECNSLKSLDIPENVILEEWAFCKCAALEKVSISDGVQIGRLAFWQCGKLAEVNIGKKVTIGDTSFFFCENLLNVVIDEDSVIEDEAFAACSSLKNIEIGEGIKNIGFGTFLGCKSLTSIKIPNGVTQIGIDAFSDCKNLMKVELPNSITIMGKDIFYNCDNLKMIIYKGTKEEWNKINKGNLDIESIKIYYTEEIHEHDYKETILKNATCTETGEKELICDICGDSKNENIPAIGHIWDEGKITKEATCEADGIKTCTCTSCGVTKTEKINALGHKIVKDEAVAATCETDGLTEGSHCLVCGKVLEEQKTIKATGHTEVVDARVEATCESEGKTEGSHCSVCGKILTEQQIIPAKGHKWDTSIVIKTPTCTEDGNRQFTCTECKKTKDEIIPAIGHLWNETYTIDKEATRTEPGKKSIHCSVCDEIKEGSEEEIPATVQIIVKDQKITNTISWTLYSDGELLINGSGKMPDYDNYNKIAPWLKYDVKKVIISDSITQIGAYSFYECSSLKEIILPDSIKAIGEGTFAYCTGITEIVLPNITSITNDLFNSCSNLVNVTIPNSVIDIGMDSFRNCTSLQEIVLPETIDGMDECAFAGCSNLKSITIPKKVTILQNGLFTECSSLTEVVIPEGVEEISDAVFDGCTSLKEITIPQSITYIGESVFNGCSSLKTVKYTGKKSEWDKIKIDDSFLKECIPECSQHDHEYTETILTNPTCTEKGEKELTCKICGESYKEEISATGHKNVVDNAIGATCEKKGKTEGSHCSVCGAVIVAQKDIPATGHKYNSWNKISESTVFDAEKQGRSCSACGRKEERTVGSKLKPTISITANKIPLKVKQKFTGFKVTGLAKGDSIVSWKSNKTKIAKISGRSNGTCTITAGKKTGKAVITVTLKSGLKKNITVTVQKGAVKTSKITGVAKNIRLIKGQKKVIKPVISPVTSKEKITYKSSNSKVASVNSKGQITAKKKGTATITVKSGKKSVKCKVTVETPGISKSSITLKAGEQYTLKVNGTGQKVEWYSENSAVAAVLNNGLVIARGSGRTNIIAKIGNKKYACSVLVEKNMENISQNYEKPKSVAVKSISFKNSEITIRKDQTYKLEIIYTPSNATIEKNVEWVSDNNKIAVVKDGIIYPIDAGSCIIVAKYGDIETSCKVNIENDKKTLKQLANNEYTEQVEKINSQADSFAASCDERINSARNEGCYSGSESQYNAEVRELTNQMRTLNIQIASLTGTTSTSGMARLARLKAELEDLKNQKADLTRKHENSMIVEEMERMKNFSEVNRQNALEQAYNEYCAKLEEIDNLY